MLVVFQLILPYIEEYRPNLDSGRFEFDTIRTVGV